MKVKVAEATDAVLDWMVGKALQPSLKEPDRFRIAEFGPLFGKGYKYPCFGLTKFSPSTDPAQAWPIIEREKIEWQWLPSSDKAHQYGARKPSLGGLNRTFCMDGPTILVAAMRCYVVSKLGPEVEVPEELK